MNEHERQDSLEMGPLFVATAANMDAGMAASRLVRAGSDSSPPSVSKLDVHVSISDVHVSTSHVHVSTSDVHVSTSDVHVATSDVHVSTSDVHVSTSDVHVSTSDVHVSTSDAWVCRLKVRCSTSDARDVWPKDRGSRWRTQVSE